MSKIFYTERDIEDFAASGQRKLEVDDDVVLTDLAYTAARKLNIEVIQMVDKPPSAPVRPYFNQSKSLKMAGSVTIKSPDQLQIIKDRVKKSVLDRSQNQVDEVLLDKIIDKVLKYTPFSQ